MTFDYSGITLSDGDTSHIHFLPDAENIQTHDYTGLEAIELPPAARETP